MSEVELREQIADMVYKKLMFLLVGDDSCLPEGHTSSGFAKNVSDSALILIKQAGYLPVEPVKLEVLGDEEIKSEIKYLYEHNPHMPIEIMIVALCQSVSQANNTHNEAKGQLYREVIHV